MHTRLAGAEICLRTHQQPHFTTPSKHRRNYSSFPPRSNSELHQTHSAAPGVHHKKITKGSTLKSSYKASVCKLMQDKTPQEAWFEAAKCGSSASIEILFYSDTFTDINACDKDGKDALYYAMQMDDLFAPIKEELVCFLLKNGARPSYTTIMHKACVKGSPKFIEELHSTYHYLWDSMDSRNRTPLHLACEFGNTDAVAYLLANGVQMDLEDAQGYPPVYGLFTESNQRKSQTLELFLKNGLSADTRVKDIPLIFYAIYHSDFYLIKKLLDYKVETNIRHGGVSPLYASMHNKNFDICRLLISQANAPASPATDSEKKILEYLFFECTQEEFEELQTLIPEITAWFLDIATLKLQEAHELLQQKEQTIKDQRETILDLENENQLLRHQKAKLVSTLENAPTAAPTNE